eukprot:scaffold32339_cov61-Phaeocystis_antarctica.AAC.3
MPRGRAARWDASLSAATGSRRNARCGRGATHASRAACSAPPARGCAAGARRGTTGGPPVAPRAVVGSLCAWRAWRGSRKRRRPRARPSCSRRWPSNLDACSSKAGGLRSSCSLIIGSCAGAGGATGGAPRSSDSRAAAVRHRSLHGSRAHAARTHAILLRGSVATRALIPAERRRRQHRGAPRSGRKGGGSATSGAIAALHPHRHPVRSWAAAAARPHSMVVHAYRKL